MQQTDRSLSMLLADNNIVLPGSDLSKTTIYFAFPLLLLLTLTNNTLFPADNAVLQPYRDLSTLLLILCITLAVLSGAAAHMVLDTAVSEMNNYISLYYAKMLIGASVIVFFIVVCTWVIVLGGIMSSPFASLLSISPILLTIQLLRDKPEDYEKVLAVIKNNWVKTNKVDLDHSHRRARRIIFGVGIAPIVIVLFTLLCGQISIAYFNLHEIILGSDFYLVVKSPWFRHVYYSIYYLSVLIAAFGILPPRVTRALTRRLF